MTERFSLYFMQTENRVLEIKISNLEESLKYEVVSKSYLVPGCKYCFLVFFAYA